MAIQQVNLGDPPTGTGGDTVRQGFDKTNQNIQELDQRATAQQQTLDQHGNTITQQGQAIDTLGQEQGNQGQAITQLQQEQQAQAQALADEIQAREQANQAVLDEMRAVEQRILNVIASFHPELAEAALYLDFPTEAFVVRES